MSQTKLLVEMMCNIQDSIMSLDESNFQYALSLILKCTNDEILEYTVNELIYLYKHRPKKEIQYINFIHELMSLDSKLKVMFKRLILKDCRLQRFFYDLGDLSLSEIDFENDSITLKRYFADIVPYYSSCTKGIQSDEHYKITKQLIYDRYYQNTIEYAVKYDDIEKLSKLTAINGFKFEDYNTDLSFFQDIVTDICCNSCVETPNLGNFAAFYGSVKCFKHIILNSDKSKLKIDSSYVFKGGNAEIIHLCDEFELIDFNRSALYYSSLYRHFDVIQWLTEVKHINYGNLEGIDHYAFADFFHFILNADENNKSALVYYCVKKKYPFFVIEYLFSIGAGIDFKYYRGTPFENIHNTLTLAFFQRDKKLYKYLKSKGMTFIWYDEDDHSQYEKEAQKFEKEINEDECLINKIEKEVNETEKEEYEIQQKEALPEEKSNVNKDFDNENESISEYENDDDFKYEFGCNNDLVKKYRKLFGYSSTFIEFEKAWNICVMLNELYHKGKDDKNEKLCQFAINEINSHNENLIIENNLFGRTIWQYFMKKMIG